MDDITASIIVTCQTQGALVAINKLRFAFLMMAKEALTFPKRFVDEFRTTQDTLWKFEKTFTEVLGSAENAVKDFRREYNLADSAARAMITDSAGLLQGMGFAVRDTLEMAKEISRLGIDLASFTGYTGGAQAATEAIIASLMGENEKLKGLRIVIREDSEEFRKMTKEIMQARNVTEQHAQALAKLRLIQEKSKPAQGDYKAPGENFTQTLNNFSQAVKQIKSNIGEVFYETFRLNDVFASITQSLTSITASWEREKNTWIYLIRDFGVDVTAVVKALALPFKWFFAEMTNGINNTITIGQAFYDNWGKIWTNGFEIVKAVFIDLFEYIKFGFGPDGVFVQLGYTASKAFAKAIKAGLTGGDIAKIFAGDFGAYWDNAVKGFAKQGKNLDTVLAKAQIKLPELKTTGFDLIREYWDIRADQILGHKAEEERFISKIQGKTNKKNTDNKTALLSFAPAISADIAKALSQYRALVQNAIDANSLEGQRLQSRRLMGGEDWNQKTANGVQTIIGQLREIGKNVAQRAGGVTFPKVNNNINDLNAVNVAPVMSPGVYIPPANSPGVESSAIQATAKTLEKILAALERDSQRLEVLERKVSEITSRGVPISVATRKY